MTAEERAKALYANEAAWDRVRVMPDEWVTLVAAAIREAEASLRADRDRLAAEVERLTREREDYREKRANEAENLRAEAERLRGVLREVEWNVVENLRIALQNLLDRAPAAEAEARRVLAVSAPRPPHVCDATCKGESHDALGAGSEGVGE